ncbi:MAG: IS3 family transposase [Anaerolineaceae bacterium]|nr:IS3 family transposase [Anaerolineaceae bacterium]
MECFWATLKRECADGVFASHTQARVELFSYISWTLYMNKEEKGGRISKLT